MPSCFFTSFDDFLSSQGRSRIFMWEPCSLRENKYLSSAKQINKNISTIHNQKRTMKSLNLNKKKTLVFHWKTLCIGLLPIKIPVKLWFLIFKIPKPWLLCLISSWGPELSYKITTFTVIKIRTFRTNINFRDTKKCPNWES